jgi:hypothetical protein
MYAPSSGDRAVPIILLAGPAIADKMIEMEFGVQIEFLPVYRYALDLQLSEEN